MSEKVDKGKDKIIQDQREDDSLSRRDFIKRGAVVGAGAAAIGGVAKTAVAASSSVDDIVWDYEVDVVVVGAGCAGLPAAIRARDLGASVMLVDQNFDVGGKMLHSGSWTSLGGGDAIQKRDIAGASDAEGMVQVEPVVEAAALEDNPELLFKDMTDWSILDTGGVPRYRFNERDLHYAWANNTVGTRQLLLDNYVRYARINGTHYGGGVSRARAATAILRIGDKTDMKAGTVTKEDVGVKGEFCSQFAPRVMGDLSSRASEGIVGNGAALARPLEWSAREKGVSFMLNRHMDEIIREEQLSGEVLGIKASYTPRHDLTSGERLESLWQDGNVDERRQSVNIRARRAVVISSGGYAGNPQVRSMFYPAMREPLFPTSGWALLGGAGRAEDGSAMTAGLAIGANLAGMQQNYQHSVTYHIKTRLATRDAYTDMYPGHPTFQFRGSAGVEVGAGGFEHIIAVNQVGKRFFSEIDLPKRPRHPRWPGGLKEGLPNDWSEHTPGDWRNASAAHKVALAQSAYTRHDGVDAALAINEGSQGPDFLSGPLWAIFDGAAIERGGWDISYPFTADNGYFFSASSVEALAEKVMQNPFSRVPMPHLKETVDRWNAFVDKAYDDDFEREGETMHRIDGPIFYAASLMIVWHDTYGGLRINGKCQVVDMQGDVIPRLYAGGEASGGGGQHGLGRGVVHGYIAGKEAAMEPNA